MHIRSLLSHRGLLAAAAAVAALPLAVAGAASATGAAHPAFQPPPVKHVWVIELENEGFSQSFGDPAADPYLAVTLPRMGALLTNYYAIGHDSLDNYIAQVTGQAPDTDTQNDCGVWTKFEPTNVITPPFGQLTGNGCVYPGSVPTIGNQLSARGLTWKAYLQDMGNSPGRDRTMPTAQGPACGHPQVGKPDPTESATAGDQYATRHEGFMYFESVIGSPAYCDAHVLSFQPLLKNLSKASTTPDFSWLSPNLCMDGHDAPARTATRAV